MGKQAHGVERSSLTFEHVAAADTFVDYLSEVKRSAERIERLEQASVRRDAEPSPRRATVTGNSHLRRVLVEAAWLYRFRPGMYAALRARQRGQSEDVKAIACKAQHRLNGRFRRLAARGKPQPQIVTAVARELLGFVWAIGVHVEQKQLAAAA